MTDDISIEVPTADEWPAFASALAYTFNEPNEEEVAEVERVIFEPERCLVAKREGEMVGTAGIFTRQLTVPGNMIPAGHVTFVSVNPTARRRGVLTRFMHRQFDDIIGAGESIAVLWASEGRIYQRFGYGSASRKLSFTIESREISLVADPAETGRIRVGAPADLRDTLVKVFEQLVADRPGWSERSARHWDYRLADPSGWRRGATALRVAIHEGEHGPDGYVLFRVSSDWNQNGPANEVRVIETVAANPAAYASLWRFILTIDLSRSATHRFAAVDEPLQFMVNEPRRLGSQLSDALWLRILDLPAALMGRRYATDVDLVLEVTDALRPSNAGRWRLTGSPTAARCVATDEPADLRCDIRVLGSVYLGGAPLTAYADAGQVTEVRPGALAAASTAFGWHRSPSTLEVF